jgi:hypothetical protein
MRIAIDKRGWAADWCLGYIFEMARHIGHYCSLTFSCTAALEFQLRLCAFFVDPYQAARARDIRRQTPLYLLRCSRCAPGVRGN